jgi:hypothetical protein
MTPRFKWINIFIRDILLILVISVVNYVVHYSSWWVAFLTGALVVLTSWQFSDMLKEVKEQREKEDGGVYQV